MGFASSSGACPVSLRRESVCRPSRNDSAFIRSTSFLIWTHLRNRYKNQTPGQLLLSSDREPAASGEHRSHQHNATRDLRLFLFTAAVSTDILYFTSIIFILHFTWLLETVLLVSQGRVAVLCGSPEGGWAHTHRPTVAYSCHAFPWT